MISRFVLALLIIPTAYCLATMIEDPTKSRHYAGCFTWMSSVQVQYSYLISTQANIIICIPMLKTQNLSVGKVIYAS